jgi:beta-glucanase (GH16 family)
MTSITGGYNASGAWLAASGAPTSWFSGSNVGPGGSLYGTSGNDFISLPGGGTAYGGTGDDSYYLWNLQDRVVELAGQGIDTLYAYVGSYLLPDNVENMVLDNAKTSGTGNALANIIAGGSGSQTIDGGAGNDILSGGAGADRFLMQGGTGWDLIRDFETGTDQLAIGGAFTQFTSFAAVQAALTQLGADTVLQLSSTDAVTFQNRSLGDFTAADFILPAAALAASLTLTFSDEFTSFSATPTGLDAGGSATWKTIFMGGGRTLSSNKEVEYYSDTTVGADPFALHAENGGSLDITATPASGLPSGLSYTSGLITTEVSAVQTYGYFEIKAKMPSGAGFWPGFWLLRADGTWPSEIDVVEILGNTPGQLYMTAHSQATGSHTQDSASLWTEDLSLAYHSYAVSWRPDKLTFYLDGTALFSTATPSDMHSPMYMLANLAVGGTGSWPGAADGVSSATMSIDSIKAYQFADLAGPYRPAAVEADMVNGSWSADRLLGSDGNDRIEGKGGSDTMTGGAGADVFAVAANEGKDVITDFQVGVDKLLLYGVTAASVASTSAGLVVTVNPYNTVTLKGVTALAAGSIVYGDAPVSGTTGADTIDLSARTLPQYVSASSGADSITGGAGDDFLLGGQGNDTLTGGAGADTFAFSFWDGHDRITDFQSGVDRIMLRSIDAATVWVNPSRDAAGNAGLEIDYGAGQSIFLPGLTALANGDIVFSV